MRDPNDPQALFDLAVYEKSQLQLRQFKSRLPSASVQNLAREVIRRLAEHDQEVSINAPSREQIEDLCHALLSDKEDAAAIYINDVRTAGASTDAVYLKYLAAAAQMLGDWWDDDLVSFPQVTLGTSRMYAIMQAMRRQSPTKIATKSAIFVAVPGESHTLGIRMATDLFRKEGWDITLLIDQDHDTLMAHLVEANTAIVGFSSGGHDSLEALSRLIVALRIRKPDNLLFVSGQIVEEAADELALIGVDGMVSDIASAMALMQTFWQRLQT